MRILETVILTRDIPEHGLVVGDIGTVAMVHAKGSGFEVEFASLDGETIAVLTLEEKDVRHTLHREIAHVRQVEA